MAAESAKVIDFQAYRNARQQTAKPAQGTGHMNVLMQPVMVWMPFWGFVPMLVAPWQQHGG